MALTADEETRVRALIAAVRKLTSGTSLSKGIKDSDTRRAVQALEQALTAVVARLQV